MEAHVCLRAARLRLGAGRVLVLKNAEYWKEFTASTQAEAENAAAAWWAEQIGFDKVCGWTVPAGLPAAGADRRWSVTIIYRRSNSATAATTMH